MRLCSARIHITADNFKKLPQQIVLKISWMQSDFNCPPSYRKAGESNTKSKHKLWQRDACVVELWIDCQVEFFI
jgi:hypothetical protein